MGSSSLYVGGNCAALSGKMNNLLSIILSKDSRSIATLPELSLEEVFQFVAENRCKCVELMCWPTGKAERRYAGVTHLDISNSCKG